MKIVKNENNGMSWYLSFKNPEECNQNNNYKLFIQGEKYD